MRGTSKRSEIYRRSSVKRVVRHAMGREKSDKIEFLLYLIRKLSRAFSKEDRSGLERVLAVFGAGGLRVLRIMVAPRKKANKMIDIKKDAHSRFQKVCNKMLIVTNLFFDTLYHNQCRVTSFFW